MNTSILTILLVGSVVAIQPCAGQTHPVGLLASKAAPKTKTAAPLAHTAAQAAALSTAPTRPLGAALGAISTAAGSTFGKGTTVVNLGLGLGVGYGYPFGSLKSTPAVSVSLEKGVLEGVGPGVIGIGGLLGYKGYHYDYPGTSYKASWNNFIVLVRGTYHYDLLHEPKLDTYAGVSLGARMERHKDTYYDNVPGTSSNSYGGTDLEAGIFLGGRYFLTDNLGAFAELGYDMSYLKLGISGCF